MTTRRVEMERFSVVSSKPFQEILASLKSAVGRPNDSKNRVQVSHQYPPIRMELWVGCIAGALEELDYVKKLAKAGFRRNRR